VDASSCAGGGLLSSGAANPCGLDLAKSLVMQLQNLYDDEIFNAGQQFGVPPYLLKQVFRYESQFWPGQWDEVHFGLGHLTPWGASTALFWDQDLQQEICRTVHGSTCPPYIPPRDVLSSQMVVALLDAVNADCPTCDLKFDIPKAEASVRIFAQVVMAHCTQSARIVYNITGEHSSKSVDYPTIWRMALFNYNVGPNCLSNTLNAVLEADPDTSKFEWSDFVEYVPKGDCQIGLTYVDKITSQAPGTIIEE
jgi:hypothetical protein